MKVALALICALTIFTTHSQAEIDEAAIVGRVIAASALCPDFTLHDAVTKLVDARTAAGETDFRQRVADSVEHVFPILVLTRGTDDFSTYCETMRSIAARRGLGG